MIIKIWPIKGRGKSRGISGGKDSLSQSIDYISDDEKTVKSKPEVYDGDRTRALFTEAQMEDPDLTWEEFCINTTDDINRAVRYASNENKTQGYVSGFLCDPEFAVEQFYQTKQINLERVRKDVKDDTGNIAYHIVQSFPPELDISDEEVHRCGIELLERMGKYNEELGVYQGVVSSHVHPVTDEEGEVRGACKHNHIIINSHRHHDFIDPERPDKMKYNDCKRSYALLQLINDKIAIEHGLPIIIEPDKDRTYSWKESSEKKQGKSWKERVRIDIENAMRASNNREEYLRAMRASGYEMRIGKSKDHGEYISYVCPDQTHRVRDFTLSQECTLARLEAYWEIKKELRQDDFVEKNEPTQDEQDKIQRLIEQNCGQLFVKIERKLSGRRKEKLAETGRSYKSKYALSTPIPTQWNENIPSVKSYFSPDEEYAIYTENQRFLAMVKGRELLLYLKKLEELERQKEEELERQKGHYYWRVDFVSTRTKKPYKVRLRDKDGRPRTSVELMIILAAVVITGETDIAEPTRKKPQYYEEKGDPIYGTRNWRVQNMLDTIRVAREEGLSTQEDINIAVQRAGKDVAKAKAAVKRIDNSLYRMQEIYTAILDFNEVRAVCEQMKKDNKPESEFTPEEQAVLEKYKQSRRVLYNATIKTDGEMAAFLERRRNLMEALEKEKQNLDKAKESYRRLSKVRYNVQLSQNRQYCYGVQSQAQEQDKTGKKEQEIVQEIPSPIVAQIAPELTDEMTEKIAGTEREAIDAEIDTMTKGTLDERIKNAERKKTQEVVDGDRENTVL